MIRTTLAAILLAALLALARTAGAPIAAADSAPQAPLADKVSPAVTNYTRLSPAIATAGQLRPGAAGELKALRFAAVLDLRGPEEGTDAERRQVEAAGLLYRNLPVTAMLPTDAEVKKFAQVVEESTNFPLIVHCASGNRVGAMWALYQAGRGVPAATALAEGRRIGMRGAREAAVAERLGLAPERP